MSPKTTVLITGANRGIGAGLVQQYLQKPDYTVIAATRDPEHVTSKKLLELPKAKGSLLVVVKIDSATATDAATAIRELEVSHNIKTLDTVIANAAIAKVTPLVSDAKASDMLEHFNVNVIGVLHLFQAVLALLSKSTRPKFVTISSVAASLGGMHAHSFPNAAYGTSKTAANYITQRIHFENPNIVAFPIHPGWVKTDMGRQGAIGLGVSPMFEEHAISVDQSAAGVVEVVSQHGIASASGQSRLILIADIALRLTEQRETQRLVTLCLTMEALWLGEHRINFVNPLAMYPSMDMSCIDGSFFDESLDVIMLLYTISY